MAKNPYTKTITVSLWLSGEALEIPNPQYEAWESQQQEIDALKAERDGWKEEALKWEQEAEILEAQAKLQAELVEKFTISIAQFAQGCEWETCTKSEQDAARGEAGYLLSLIQPTVSAKEVKRNPGNMHIDSSMPDEKER